jgi:HD-GYP domain-containing protein (c-di-GMP phosphodiesterase class II)
VVQSGSPYLASNVRKDARLSNRVDKKLKFETHDLLAVPLQAAGKTLGVIEVLNKKDGQPFNSTDLELLTALTTQIALIIENARLFLAAEAKVGQLATLTELAAVLNSSLDPKQVRTRAMQAAVKLLGCETGSLYLIDHDRHELYFEVALGDKGDVFKEIRLKIGEGIAGWVAAEGRSLLIPDCSKDPRWSSKGDKKSKFQTRNMVTVPVNAKDKVIGVLQAINKLGDRLFNEEDLRLLEALADQVAIALENARLYEEQRQTFLQTAQALAAAIEKRDIYTGGHTRRVRDYSLATAKYLTLDPADREWLELAAILHDVGKIGVDDIVLRKPGKLTDEEFAQIRAHPTIGYEIMSHIKTLAKVIPGMRHHHERPDGKGYPDGLQDGKIPFLARIIAVADVYDAMTSDRPYRKGLSDQAALDEIRKFSGAQFDETVVAAFVQAHTAGEIIGQHGRAETIVGSSQ